MEIGYHASHEQFAPVELLDCVRLAESRGFDAAMCSDHFSPFITDQGSSGFAWAWLGSALEATSLSFGTVNAPGYRYHPAIVAQAIATLGQMYPGRFWVALGTGHRVNEHFTGVPWPEKHERQERLLECVDIVRRLLDGEAVDRHGPVRVRNARLWVSPREPVPLFGAAIQRPTAQWLGTWADGLITVAQPPDQLRGMISAFREAGGEGKPVFVQAQLCFAGSDQKARDIARREWRSALLAPETMEDMPTAAHVDGATGTVRPEDMTNAVCTGSAPGAFIDWLRAFEEQGVDRVYLHNVNRNQRQFIETFGERVLPEVRKQ